MRHLRPFAALLSIAAITIACSSPGASSGQQSSAASSGATGAASAGASSAAEASQPAASTGGGGGGGANGSVTYEISGGYTRSGELPWLPLASTFTNGVWYLAFTDPTGTGNQDVLSISGTTGTTIVIFANTEFAISAGVEPACTFTFTRQEANGAAGSFDCRGLQGVKTDGTVVLVDFKGDFDGHI